MGMVAYWFELPPGAQIHSVFNVSQLKEAVGNATYTQPVPPCLNVDMELQLQPAEVHQFRVLPDGFQRVLIAWKGLPDFESTWEDFGLIDSLFPAIHLEDKVNVLGGRIDRPL